MSNGIVPSLLIATIAGCMSLLVLLSLSKLFFRSTRATKQRPPNNSSRSRPIFDKFLHAPKIATEPLPVPLQEQLNNRGLASWTKHHYPMAKYTFDKAIAQFGDDPVLLNNRGLVHLKIGDLRHALEDFDLALYIDHRCTSARINRGLVALAEQNWQAAIDAFSSAIKFHPTASIAYNNRGCAYWYIGEREKALLDFAHSCDRLPHLELAIRNYRLLADNRNIIGMTPVELHTIDFQVAYCIAYHESSISKDSLKNMTPQLDKTTWKSQKHRLELE